MADATCSIDECSNPAQYKRARLCNKHYLRLRRHGDPTAGGTELGAPAALMKAAIDSATDECIEWPYAKTSAGYGQIRHHGRAQIVTRLVLTATIGPPPEPNSHAAHAPGVCHNPGCINPRHLRWASAWENAQDRCADGTVLAGENHPGSKLTTAQVLEILIDQRPLAAIAADHKIGVMQVSRIKNRKTWNRLIGGTR